MRRLLALVLVLTVIVASCATEWVDDDARQHSRRAVVLPSPGTAPTTSVPGPEPATFVVGECPMPVQSGDAERLTCGVLDVAIDRDDPAAGRAQVAVAIIASDSPTPAPDPVVYLHGGPGGLALSDYIEWVFPPHPLLAERDLILVDQRGSGWSEPSLNCPKAEDASQPVAALLACQDELDDGVSLDHFTTADIAADIADLRRALDIDQWNLYGVSYGTRVALTVLDVDPDGVRAAVLDSAYPPEVDAYMEQVANGSAAIDGVLAACASDLRCGDAFGDLRDDLDALLVDLAAGPMPVDVEGDEPRLVVDDTLVASSLFSALYDRFTIPDVPLAVQTAVDGDLATALDLLGAADGLRGGFQSEEEQYESLFDAELAFWAPECAEEIGLAVRTEVRDAIDVDEPVQAALLDEVESAFDVCSRLDVAPADPSTQDAIDSAVPTLLLVGEFDPITPPTWSRRAAAALADPSVIVVTGSGHAPSFEQCPREAMVAFVQDPTAPPATPCLAEMQGLPFSLE